MVERERVPKDLFLTNFWPKLQGQTVVVGGFLGNVLAGATCMLPYHIELAPHMQLAPVVGKRVKNR